MYHDILNQNRTKHVTWYQLALIYFSGTTMFQVASLLSAVVIVQRGGSKLSEYFRGLVRSLDGGQNFLAKPLKMVVGAKS